MSETYLERLETEVAIHKGDADKPHFKQFISDIDKACKRIREHAAEIARLKEAIRWLQQLVDKQAEDAGIWFIAQYASEGYLQERLRELHTAIEQAAIDAGKDGAS